eukprot:scaffold4950_cov99-Isochrysis_galbana.AAC.4
MGLMISNRPPLSVVVYYKSSSYTVSTQCQRQRSWTPTDTHGLQPTAVVSRTAAGVIKWPRQAEYDAEAWKAVRDPPTNI